MIVCMVVSDITTTPSSLRAHYKCSISLKQIKKVLFAHFVVFDNSCLDETKCGSRVTSLDALSTFAQTISSNSKNLPPLVNMRNIERALLKALYCTFSTRPCIIIVTIKPTIYYMPCCHMTLPNTCRKVSLGFNWISTLVTLPTLNLFISRL